MDSARPLEPWSPVKVMARRLAVMVSWPLLPSGSQTQVSCLLETLCQIMVLG